MSLLTWLSSRAEQRAFSLESGNSAAYIAVDFASELGIAALGDGGPQAPGARDVAGYPPVSQALQMIAGDCAKLSLQVKRRVGDDLVPLGLEHYAQQLIDPFGRPNETETTFDLFFQWYWDALLWGGGYLWIQRSGATPVALYRMLPDRTQIAANKRTVTTYVWDADRGKYVPVGLPIDDVLCLQGLTILDSPENPITAYRNTWRQALSAGEFTTRFFDQGTQAGGILMVPPGASDRAVENTESAVKARSQRENWFKTLVLKDGFRWQSTTSDLKSATAVELNEDSARQVCRIFNLPPSKLGLRDSMSYNSRQADRQEYLDSCLSSWLIQGRSQAHRKLILPSEQTTHIVDYTFDELSLLNLTERANVANMGLDRGWLTAPEVRRWMRLGPIRASQSDAQ
jgi:HK97 family phage portal protein